jgi:hypothetical protein
MIFPKRVKDFAKVAFDYWFQEQYEKGVKKYYVPLTTFNGRDAFEDAMQESVDLVMYVNQLRLERNDLCKVIKNAIALDELPDSVKEYVQRYG